MNKPDLKACELFEEIIKDYQWESTPGHDNKEMKKMYATDRKDLRHVLSLYRKGKWKEARDAAGNLDTFVREYIPDKIWDDINQ